MESGQFVFVSSAGSRRRCGGGSGFRARRRHRRAGRDACAWRDPGERVSQGGGAHLVLRQFGRPVHHRDLQAARDGCDLGRNLPRPLRRRRSEIAPLPLWRAGQFSWSHRAAAGDSRLSHIVRHAGRDAVEVRAGARGTTAMRGTRRSACPGRGISNGRCACSRSARSRPTCWTMATSSTAPR